MPPNVCDHFPKDSVTFFNPPGPVLCRLRPEQKAIKEPGSNAFLLSLVSDKVVLNIMPIDVTQQNNFLLISDKLYLYPCCTLPSIFAVNFRVHTS